LKGNKKPPIFLRGLIKTLGTSFFRDGWQLEAQAFFTPNFSYNCRKQPSFSSLDKNISATGIAFFVGFG